MVGDDRLLVALCIELGYTMLIRLRKAGVDKRNVSGRTCSDIAGEWSRVSGRCDATSLAIQRRIDAKNTHEMTPYVIFALGAIGFPRSSTAESIMSVCRTEAIMMNSEASAKCRPGQTLWEQAVCRK